MYDLVNIFSVFLPQLLLYPNPSDPLNSHAAALMFKEPDTYKARIREHVKKHASVDFKLQEDEDEVTITHRNKTLSHVSFFSRLTRLSQLFSHLSIFAWHVVTSAVRISLTLRCLDALPPSVCLSASNLLCRTRRAKATAARARLRMRMRTMMAAP